MGHKSLTKKRAALLRYLENSNEQSIRSIARKLNRPYKRVREDIHALAGMNLVGIQPQIVNGRTTFRVTPIGEGRRKPTLSYPRIWSAPLESVSDDTFIAALFADPKFEDVLACSLHYGLPQMRRVHMEMIRAAVGTNDGRLVTALAMSKRMLDNIEIGFSRAA